MSHFPPGAISAERWGKLEQKEQRPKVMGHLGAGEEPGEKETGRKQLNLGNPFLKILPKGAEMSMCEVTEVLLVTNDRDFH